jgi:hypothetical protein
VEVRLGKSCLPRCSPHFRPSLFRRDRDCFIMVYSCAFTGARATAWCLLIHAEAPFFTAIYAYSHDSPLKFVG